MTTARRGMSTEQAVVVERLTTAQQHLGTAIYALVRGGTPVTGIHDALAAIGEAQYWLGWDDAVTQTQEVTDAR